MKKLAIALFAVVCALMFIAPAYADDRVSLYGSMRVRGWAEDYTDGTDASWFDQRFRIGTKIKVADDVYVELRVDYGEGQWGDDYNGLITRPRATGNFATTIDIDRGFMNIDKEMWSLRVGQQYMGLGIAQVLDANATGAILRLKLPVAVSLMYAKIDENGSFNDDNANDDNDMYGINLSYDADAFSADLFAATADDGATDNNPMMFGINADAALGMVNLTGELAFAGGDDGAGTDYVGTQFYLKASANLSDAFSLGGEILYALAADAGESQLTNLSNWWSFVPMSSNTPFDADWSASPTAEPFSPFYNGVDANGNPISANAGVQGITLYGAYKVMDALSFGAKVGYFTPEDDNLTPTDDITSFNVWASYALASNTKFDVAYLYSDYDNLSDEYATMVARLQVNF